MEGIVANNHLESLRKKQKLFMEADFNDQNRANWHIALGFLAIAAISVLISTLVYTIIRIPDYL